MTNLTNKEVVTGFFEIYNSQDYETIHQYIAPDYLDHGLPFVRSPDDAIKIIKSVHQAFPDLKVIIDDLMVENDKVAFRGHFSGTHLGEFAGMPSSGAKVEFEALEILKVENQQITESWGYWPMALITSQIQDLKKPY